MQYQYSKNKGTTQGSNEAATSQNTFDYETEYGTNPQDIPHTFNGSLAYLIPGQGLWRGGWRVGGIFNARSGVPINVVISRSDNATVNGVPVTNIPGGNSRGTQRPDVVPGVDPYLKDGVRWLNPAAFTTPQPGTFGNLPRNALRGPEFAQLDLMFSKDFQFVRSQSFQFRVEVFNLTNRLNYENPAATLPGSGAPGAPFTDAQAGTFGYMLGPLNRTSASARRARRSYLSGTPSNAAKREENRSLPSSRTTPIESPGLQRRPAWHFDSVSSPGTKTFTTSSARSRPSCVSGPRSWSRCWPRNRCSGTRRMKSKKSSTSAIT